MKLSFYAFLLLCATAATGAGAATVACPDLSAALQVAACPSEDDLKFTFNGFCSDNARMYGKDTEVCTDYQRYRKLKNVALWESRDGEFQAYVACDQPPARVKAAQAAALAIAKKGKITQIVCSYGDGLVFTKRMRAECTVDAATNCATDAAACVARCE